MLFNFVLLATQSHMRYFSLQVPQFILEDANTQSTPCRLVCTQPRRISALSVSERVASERGERLGQTVGYQIRLDNRYMFHNCVHSRMSRIMQVLFNKYFMFGRVIWNFHTVYYFIFDRIVCVLVSFHKWGHFVMLTCIIKTLNLIIIQSWTYLFTL